MLINRKRNRKQLQPFTENACEKNFSYKFVKKPFCYQNFENINLDTRQLQNQIDRSNEKPKKFYEAEEEKSSFFRYGNEFQDAQTSECEETLQNHQIAPNGL